MWWKTLINSFEISQSTKKAYAIQIERLIEETGQPLEYILRHPQETINTLDSLNTSIVTKRSRISSLCGLLKHWDEGKKKYTTEHQQWCSFQRDLNRSISEKALDGEASEREIINWVPWHKVLAREKELSKTQYGSNEHLLLAMYTHIEPMRADFGNVKLYFSDPPDCTRTREGNFVYCSKDPQKSYICLNQYKTMKKYGRFHRKLPDSLVQIIHANLVIQPREYLFAFDGEPYTKKNSFGKYANRIFNNLFQKRMTISLMRHSFISAIDFNMTKAKDLIQVSRNMQHSLGMQQYYRRHVPEVAVDLREQSQPEPVRATHSHSHHHVVRNEPRPKKKKKQSHGERSFYI